MIFLERRKRRNPLERVILLFLLVFFILIVVGLFVLMYIVFFSSIQSSTPSSQYVLFYFHHQLGIHHPLLFLKILRKSVPVYHRFPRSFVLTIIRPRYGVSFDGNQYYGLNFMPDMYSQTVLLW